MSETMRIRSSAQKPVAGSGQTGTLRDSEVRYRRLFETAQDGILILDAKTGQISDVNPFLIDMLGYTHQELLGKKLWEIGLFKDTAVSTAAFKVLQETGYVRYQDLPLETKTGRAINVEFVSNTYYVDCQKVIQCNIRDITERKKSENMTALSLRVLERLNKPGTQKEMIHDILLVIQELSRCEAVGIRLNDGEDFPYYAYKGFVDEHFESENSLLCKDKTGHICRDSVGKPLLECMCGKIVGGHFVPRGPFFTENGSFWTNDIAGYISEATEQERGEITRGRCIQEGYKSLALIPLISPEGIIGLLQLNSLKRDRFTLEMIKHFESIGQSIGIVLNQKRAEEALRQSEEKLQRVFASIADGILILDMKGKIIDCNENTVSMTHCISRDEIIGKSILDFLPANDKYRAMVNLQLTIATGSSNNLQYTIVRPDRSSFPIEISNNIARDKSGLPVFMILNFTDITERKQMEDRLLHSYEQEKLQREELEEEAKTRNLFIDVLGHELRTPLTPILASTGMLAEILDSKSDSIEKKLSLNIYRSAKTLAIRLEELLELAKYSRGAFTLNREKTDIKKFITDVLARFQAALDLNKQQVVVEFFEKTVQADIDRSRLEQVIINLLSNASKFSSSGGRIKLTAKAHDGNIDIEVRDEGIGITPEEQQRLFQPYHRVEQDRQKYPGIGLGLAVSKKIIEAHMGKIWVTSRLGQGSTFGFSIPLPS
jgi:PAS domain S-box-containing protein